MCIRDRKEQRNDLEKCLAKLLFDLSRGEKRLKVYQQMKTSALAILNGKMVTTMNVITQLMRFQQIT